jgi:hypothetical protein
MSSACHLLGISAYCRDAAAAMLGDGKIIAAEAFTWRNDILEPNAAHKSAGPAFLK